MSTNDVKSARRVLDILQFFAATRAPATLSQIVAGLGIPKSSCLALLDTLLLRPHWCTAKRLVT